MHMFELFTKKTSKILIHLFYFIFCLKLYYAAIIIKFNGYDGPVHE